jgi:hypothetical protein
VDLPVVCRGVQPWRKLWYPIFELWSYFKYYIETIDFRIHEIFEYTRSSFVCKEGCRFSMGWCMTQHEGALLPTLLCSLQRCYPNITITWDCWICLFAVLLRFTLSFVYKVYIGFLSHVRDWTVAVAQYSKFAC